MYYGCSQTIMKSKISCCLFLFLVKSYGDFSPHDSIILLILLAWIIGERSSLFLTKIFLSAIIVFLFNFIQMRDALGQSNIYFDDLFAEGIPWSTILFYSVNGILSCINLLILHIFCYVACINQVFHRNLRLVSANIYLAFFLTATGDLIYGLLILTQVSDKKYDIVFWLFRFEAAFATQLWRAAFLTIVLERTAATIFYKNYEKRGPLWLALALMFLAIVIASLIISTYYVFKVHVFITQGLIGLLDLFCILSITLLSWSNKTLSKHRLNTETTLTQRYQLTENLRVLQIMMPLIIVGTVFDIMALLSSFLQVAIEYDGILKYPFYFLITNLYVTVAFCIYMKKDQRIWQRVHRVLCKGSTVAPENSVIHFDGKLFVIPTSTSMNLHFKQLESYWKFRELDGLT